MKKIIALVLATALLVLSGCTKPNVTYQKFSGSFLGTFDTVIQFIGFAQSQESFDERAAYIKNRFTQLHQLYDVYNEYEGINNVYTINKNAGKSKVKVEKELLDLIVLCKEKYEITKRKVNIAMGGVLGLWHKHMTEGLLNPETATIPSMAELQALNQHSDMNAIEIDVENSEIYVSDPNVQLNVGAVAKGYAVEIVAQELLKSSMPSFIISGGGNVRTGEPPMDGRANWGVGIQDPQGVVTGTDSSDIVETLYLNNTSVVTSGTYQRYYIVDGKQYHHIIDPATLMPQYYFTSVTIVTKDSGMADMLSTTLFLMPYEEGLEYVKSLDGVEAMWVFEDNSIKMTDGLKPYAKSMGGTAGVK